MMAVDVNPAGVSRLTGFMYELWLLKIRAGNPSLAVLAKRTGLPKSTLHDGLRRDRATLPSLELVRRVVTALDGSSEDVRAWEAAWCQLAIDLFLPQRVAG
jgi:hypothetical protein